MDKLLSDISFQSADNLVDGLTKAEEEAELVTGKGGLEESDISGAVRERAAMSVRPMYFTADQRELSTLTASGRCASIFPKL